MARVVSFTLDIWTCKGILLCYCLDLGLKVFKLVITFVFFLLMLHLLFYVIIAINKSYHHHSHKCILVYEVGSLDYGFLTCR